MNASIKLRNAALLGGSLLGALAGTTTALFFYVRQEVVRRGYPTWDECECDFKTQEIIFQVWHSRLSQRGETIVAQERGLYLVRLPQWLRRTLHYAAQAGAILNPGQHYIERITLTPRQSYQFAAILHTSTTNEDLPEPLYTEEAFVTWRREILHYPIYPLDACVSRLYPVNITPEQANSQEGLPALWDPVKNLPLPTAGTLLKTPDGTHVDCIGWSPTQITYCTARIKNI